MNNETDIKTYLLNYIQYLRDYKIKYNYNNTINTYNSLKKHLRHNIKGGEIKFKGGGEGKTEGTASNLTTKVNSLLQSFMNYKNMAPQIKNLKENMNELDKRLASMSKDLSKIDQESLLRIDDKAVLQMG